MSSEQLRRLLLSNPVISGNFNNSGLFSQNRTQVFRTAQGETVTNVIDPLGNIVENWVQRPDGSVTHFQADAFGRILKADQTNRDGSRYQATALNDGSIVETKVNAQGKVLEEELTQPNGVGLRIVSDGNQVTDTRITRKK